ncbi:hypothetical protein H3N56_02630 [Cetobacterium sp. 2A]|uniref:hypothetical protein n=1 Tax=Cetobacterium sp. 2A TaxID=2754723 RepID=UPI00163B83F5|nr:hypothetical protein [Cetobacterium sp. 2A]MBC2855389.1 hypothetical protein [Cetobacterium sp. 2A]
MPKRNLKIQTNIEIIAKDYMKIARVETLAELKSTTYWEYYQKEVRGLSNVKTIVNVNEIIKKSENIENISKEVIQKLLE